MKKIYFAFLAMLCLGSFTLQAASWYPTNVIQVAPDAGGIPPSTGNGSLRDALTANGSAIYELQRGQVYYVNGTCAFAANNVIVRAAAGSGARPIIVPYTLSGTSSDVFSSAANLRFENLYIYGLEYGSTAPTRRGIIRMSGGTNFEFENCTFDGASTAGLLRFENLNASLTSPFLINVNNCIFRNAVDYTNIANARGIDLRDSKGVSLRITNSTFYSISAQIVRQGANQVDSLIFKNNTVFGSAQTFIVGVAEKAVIKNNIFYNMVLNGAAATPSGIISFTALDPSITRDITIKNNLFYRESAFDVLLTKSTTRFLANLVLDAVGYTLKNTSPAQLVISDTLNNSVLFKNPPTSLMPFYTYTWTNNVTAIPTDQQTFMRRETTGFVGDNLSQVNKYDFSYPTTSPATTAGEGGTPLGSAQWTPFVQSGLINIDTKENIKYYFNNETNKLYVTLGFSTSLVKVSLYTLNGMLLSNRLIVPNDQKFEYVLPNLLRGVYLFTIESDGKNVSGKFVY